MKRAAYRRQVFLVRLMQRLHFGQQQAMLLQAVLLGLAGALAALAFDAATDAVQWLCTGTWCGRVACFMQLPDWARVLLPALGAVLAALVLLWARRVDPRPMPEYMESFSLRSGRLPRRQGFLRSLSAVLSLGTGACIGKEGALIQVSAVAASAAGRWLNVSPTRLRVMVGCGAAAGMTAAFHTPLAACLFVSEVLVGTFSISYLAPLLLASCTAYVLIWMMGRTEALYAVPGPAFCSLSQVLACVLLAVLAALCGRAWVGFTRLARRHLGGKPCWLVPRMAAAGLLVGLAAVADPYVVGHGHESICALLQGRLDAAHAATLLGMKAVLVAVVFGVGTMGGMLTPTLMVGCFTGALFGWGAQAMGLGGGMVPYALAGMAAFFAVACRAPVTALILVIEFTMDAALTFPLMLAVGAAYGVSRMLPAGSLYDGAAADSGPGVDSTRVASIMRRSPLRVATSTPMERVLHQMVRFPDENVPVVDESGRFAGVLAAEDIADSAPDTPAGSLMRTDIPRLSPTDGIPEALAAFRSTPLNSLPVVHPGSHALFGIVSRTELYRTSALLLRKELSRRR